MLLNTFFSISSVNEVHEQDQPLTGTNYKVRVGVNINPDHTIFNGHFPGNPIVPGVCQIQMVTEILGELHHKKIRLISADNIKFLSMINPVMTDSYFYDLNCRVISDDEMAVNVFAYKDQIAFLKFKAIYTSTDLNILSDG